MLYVKNFIVPRGETNAYADEEKIIERNVPNAKKWRERERERRQSEKGKHGRKRRMEEECISLVPCGRQIFWVDSCQLRAVSTEDYSLTYRAAPLYALSAVCVYFFPCVFIFFPLSLFLFFFFYKTPSLLIFRCVKSSNFLTNAGIPGFSTRASLFPHDGSPGCLRWSSSYQRFATAYASTIFWGCRLSERALSIGIKFAMYKGRIALRLGKYESFENLSWVMKKRLKNLVVMR